jgi:signal transduction histidine kinase
LTQAGLHPSLKSRLARLAGSLVGRLVLLASIWSLALLIAAGVALTASFNASTLERFDQGLSEDADDLYAGVAVGPDGEMYPPAITDVRATRVYSGKYWQILELEKDGHLHSLVRSRSMWDAEDLAYDSAAIRKLQPKSTKPLFYDGMGPQTQPLRIAAIERILPGRKAPVVFLVGQDRTSIDDDISRFTLITSGALLALGLGLVGAVVVQVRIGLQPLFRMRSDLAEVRQGKAEALSGDYPAELQPLSDELNALLDHNREVVERQRTHVGNLAHALKTPLSAMLMEAATQPGPLAEVVERQAQAMRGHVEHHLRRARAAARSQSLGQRTPIAPALEELGRTLEKVYRTRDLDIDPGPADLNFAGERQDLLEMVGNVLENACKWSRSEVAASVVALDERRLMITIEDDGPGLPADKRSEVLRRGARLDESAPGSGLGLNIVDDLARAYGGVLRLGDSERGGLKVELELPRADG